MTTSVTSAGDKGRPTDPPPRPPREPDPGDCCGEGCLRCVLDVFDAAQTRYEAELARWQARQPE